MAGNLNDLFAGTAEKSMPASAKKPPVPQRCISLDATNGGNGGAMSGLGRPSLPRNKKPQLTAEQLRPVHHQSVPNFNQNKNDMGKRNAFERMR